MDVWTPDLLPYNDVGVYDSTKYMRAVPLSVTNEGYIQWLNPVALETTCIMDVTDFPFDTQASPIIVAMLFFLFEIV